MEVKVATTTTTSFQWPGRGGGGGRSLALKPSSFLGTQCGKLQRSKSCELWKQFSSSTKKKKIGLQLHSPLRRVCSSDFFSDDHRLRNVKLLHESVPGLASLEAPWAEIVNHSSIERKANSVELPLSLKIIKRKLQVQDQAPSAASMATTTISTDCSIDKAFASMVFMIEELHSFAMQAKDGHGFFSKEMHASLLWIFQRVFSQTPTLMLYLMILLANFTAHSVASDLASPKESNVSNQGMREDEASLWESIVQEADQMNGCCSVDHDMRLSLVSPINATIELDDNGQYTRTELSYKIGLAQEPDNPLLLANYAQFLYVVSQDYDRAEKWFRKAIESEEVDAEAYSKYAIFQWKVRKDLWAAEENFLEAISVDPTNTFYAANYANFLWQTGGEETCFPLESSDSPRETA